MRSKWRSLFVDINYEGLAKLRKFLERPNGAYTVGPFTFEAVAHGGVWIRGWPPYSNSTQEGEEMPQKVVPIKGRVLIKPAEAPEKIGGIVLADQTRANMYPEQGEVLAVGEGVTTIKVGQVAVFSRHAGPEIEFEKVRYKMLKEEEILGYIEK